MHLALWIIPIVLVIAATVHMLLASKPQPKGRIVEIWLLHVLFWGVGVHSLVVGYVLISGKMAMELAVRMGWPPGSPFQALLAGRLFAYGLCALAVVWFRGGWLLGLGVAALVFGFGRTLLFLLEGPPPLALLQAVIYNVVGALVLIVLLISYRVRAGPDRFWYPVPPLPELPQDEI
jgi:polyferredoxin